MAQFCFHRLRVAVHVEFRDGSLENGRGRADMNEQSECTVCGGALWVCEDHADKPWGRTSNRADACHCGGAGVPCLAYT